jgi:hypothetical protein
MKLTATKGGMAEVRVNGVTVSEHTSWWKAAEQAFIRERANPADVVTIFTAQEIRVEAQADPLPEPAPVIVPPSSEVLWQWDAKQVAPFSIHAKPGDPPRVTLVNVGGRPGVRLQTLPGDDNVNGSGAMERCDLRLPNYLSDAVEGSKQRVKHGIWIPDDYAELPMSPANAQPWYVGILANWHHGADKGGQANAQLKAMPPTGTDPGRPVGLNFEIHGGDFAKPTVANYHIGPIVRNTWLDFELEMLWTSTTSGYFNGWLNGKQFMAYTGPTLYVGDFAYFKLANYHTPLPLDENGVGKSSAIVHGAVAIERA